jgi:hypothetical protein
MQPLDGRLLVIANMMRRWTRRPQAYTERGASR